MFQDFNPWHPMPEQESSETTLILIQLSTGSAHYFRLSWAAEVSWLVRNRVATEWMHTGMSVQRCEQTYQGPVAYYLFNPCALTTFVFVSALRPSERDVTRQIWDQHFSFMFFIFKFEIFLFIKELLLCDLWVNGAGPLSHRQLFWKEKLS